MTVPERLAALRGLMKQQGIDAYLVPTDDFHGSEYVGEHFKCRAYITGFTGSAGTALITQDMAGLWTDGRYFLQAERQLAGSGVTLFRMGQEGVPAIDDFLADKLTSGQTLGFDGRTMSDAGGRKLADRLAKKGVAAAFRLDLVGDIWSDRPPLSCEKVWLLDTKYTGRTRLQKIARIREDMEKLGADHFLLTSLDDIAWLLNIRGNDVACNPVVLSYLIMTDRSVTLFVQEKAIGREVREALEKDGITLASYESFYEAAASLEDDSRILVDPGKINYSLRRLLPSRAKLIEAANPTLMAKAIKNEVETANIRQAHLKDGVAVTRFIYWLKHRVGAEPITELSAAKKLEQLRSEGGNYLGPSFEPIIAYAQHGAIIHYSPTEETDIPLEQRAMVLADTGGQYLEGTTDITRTIVLGETTRQEKEFFTRVLRGNLNLAGAKFREGCSGLSLDCLAREPLWEIGEDYNHGTGHGVGYCLNVHEGPNSFHWKAYPGRKAETILEEGMLTSDEPGYYRENAFGIRHENLMLCRKAEKTAAGQFMDFETVTLVPFDLEAVLPEMMQPREKELLNAYHCRVFEQISPFLQGDELAWLKQATRAI